MSYHNQESNKLGVGEKEDRFAEEGIEIIEQNNQTDILGETEEQEQISHEVEITLDQLSREQRISFMCKVIFILNVLVGTGLIAMFLFLHVGLLNKYVTKDKQLLWISIGAHVVFLIIIIVFPKLARYEPSNYLLLIVFNINQCLLKGTVLAFLPYQEEVLISYAVWFAVCLGMSMITWQEIAQVSLLRSLVLVTLVVICGFLILWSLFPFVKTIVICCVIVVYLLSLSLVFGSHTAIQEDAQNYTEKDFVFVSLTFYLQFIGLIVLFILTIIGKLKSFITYLWYADFRG